MRGGEGLKGLCDRLGSNEGGGEGREDGLRGLFRRAGYGRLVDAGEGGPTGDVRCEG
jgi:hypothetical protein